MVQPQILIIFKTSIEKLLYICRPEMHIAVVTHSAFLRTLGELLGENLAGYARSQLSALFENCELRSVVLMDQSGCTSVPCRHSFCP